MRCGEIRYGRHAGLGWIGKCALLVTEQFGSAVRLNKILTDAPLPTATAITDSRCGECRACVDACPARAPTGESWHPSIELEAYYDPSACRDATVKLALERTGIEATVCGICIAACPWTKRYIQERIRPGDPSSSGC